MQTSDKLLSDTTIDINEDIQSLPPQDAEDLQDRFSDLKKQWTAVNDALAVRLVELRFKECAEIIHDWIRGAEKSLARMRSRVTFGCMGDVEKHISQFKVWVRGQFLVVVGISVCCLSGGLINCSVCRCIGQVAN